MYETQDEVYRFFLHNINTINLTDGTDIKM